MSKSRGGMAGSPRRTMVSAGPGGGLLGREMPSTSEERTGLLMPDSSTSGSGFLGGGKTAVTPRRSSAASTSGRDTLTATSAGNRKRSASSLTSLNADGGPGWKLKYQDFMPETKQGSTASALDVVDWESQESFSSLVSRANRWLGANPEVRVKSCQTVTWMSHDRTRLNGNFAELMVMSKSIADNAASYYVRGLRLWLVPALSWGSSSRPPSSSSLTLPSSLTCLDFTPDRTKTNTVQGLVTLVNSELEEQQLKGRVMAIETVFAPIIDSILDSGVTRWKENVFDDNQYAYILRVYCSGLADELPAPAGLENQRIGVRDIIPQLNDDGNGYEGFEDLCDRAATWMKEAADVVIVNLQSIMVLKESGTPHSELGSACYYTSPGTRSDSPVEFFRILRVVFRRRPSSAGSRSAAATGFKSVDSTPSSLHRTGGKTNERRPSAVGPTAEGQHVSASSKSFTYESFTPELVRDPTHTLSSAGANNGHRVETMNETFAKVIAFLRSAGPTEVICAEVVFNPMQLYIQTADCLSTAQEEVNFLYTIRLFLTRPSGKTDGSLRSVRRASNLSVACSRGPGEHTTPGLGRNGSASVLGASDEHPGPIFLRHVVSRRFPYRWLILALSAISCMTIIVVVSVVYSNR